MIVHEVFDRVLARLGLAKGKHCWEQSRDSTVTKQLTSSDSGLTLSVNRISEGNGAYSAQSTELQGLQLKTRRSSKGCLPTGRPPNGINVLNYACISFSPLFKKKCLGPQLLGFLFKKFSIPLTLSVLGLLPCTLYKELHYRHTHGCLPFLKLISQDNVTRNTCWVQICA